MVQGMRKIFGLCLIAWAAMLFAETGIAAGAEGLPTNNKMLQPEGLDYAGIYVLRQIDPNLTGSGVNFAVVCRSITYLDGEPQNDYRPDTQHNCFAGKNFGFYDQGEPPAAVSAHSTAVCSVLFGEDSNAFNQQVEQFHFEGVAPHAQADIYEFWHFLINNVFPGFPPVADILTADIGSQFEDWWTRGIESMAEHHGLIVVAGIGNGSDAYDPLLYPGAGANVIGVGVVDSVNIDDPGVNLAHFSLAYPEHSSFGPTSDRRCKPDIVAPGNCLVARVSDPNGYKTSGDWSSFSTPIVAGTIGLLIQKARQDPNLSDAVSPEGGNCVVKAVLLNSATKLPYWHKGQLKKDDDHTAPLDWIQGAGALNAVGAYQQLIAGRNRPSEVATTGWDLNRLEKTDKSKNIYKTTIKEPRDKFIAATTVWNRHYSDFYPFEPMPEKDADLRLELWAIDPNDPNNNYLLDYSDSSTDNVEHIYCRLDANHTNYKIVVSNNNIGDPNQTATSQTYGLAWNVSNAPESNSIFWYDINGDGVVNDSDFVMLLNNLLASRKSPDAYVVGDINTDGVIDINDIQVFFKHKNLKADWYGD